MPGRRPWVAPAVLLAVGLALAAGGMLWAVATGVAVPYPDPTPEMAAYEARHGRVVDALLLSGLALVATGLLWGAAWLARVLWKRTPATGPRGRP